MSLKTVLIKTNKNYMMRFLEESKISLKSLIVKIFLIYLVPYKD